MISTYGFFVSQRFGRILSVAFLLFAGSVFEGRAQLAFPVIDSFSPTNGRSGTTVTITGSNLANSTLLVFNRSALLPGSFKVENGIVTAQVPVGASTGRLRLTTTSGTGAKGTATVSEGQVTTITFSPGGTGYDTNTKINLLGGSGSGASADLVLNGSGAITSITNLIGGSNYVSAPTVVLAN